MCCFHVQKVHSISVDVSLESSKDYIQQELSGFPPVDVLVNSAGVTHSANFQDTTSETFEVCHRIQVLVYYGGASETEEMS